MVVWKCNFCVTTCHESSRKETSRAILSFLLDCSFWLPCQTQSSLSPVLDHMEQMCRLESGAPVFVLAAVTYLSVSSESSQQIIWICNINFKDTILLAHFSCGLIFSQGGFIMLVGLLLLSVAEAHGQHKMHDLWAVFCIFPLSRWSWLHLSDSSQLLHSKQVRWERMSSMCTWRNGCNEDTHATDLWNTGNVYYKLRTGFPILHI